MLLCFGCCTGLTNALHLNSKPFQPEAGRKFASQFDRPQQIEIQISEGAAARANQMIMRMVIGIDKP